ncbi:hypothetical protein [Aureimonas mangrovi]|uniref:hypothetical protein n=1 Tax=Aureimonas mangrovi TaxID=2758041 RepID=UPI00163D9373|nr:hypothetical protein [Aureimonas mangrovi]
MIETLESWLAARRAYYAALVEHDLGVEPTDKAAWKRFYGANPRVALARLPAEIADAHDGAAWPSAREIELRDWVRAGCPGPCPVVISDNVDTLNLKRLLVATARAAGPGWVYEIDGRLLWRADHE